MKLWTNLTSFFSHGGCPYCGSSDTGTSPNGVRVCYSCGKSGW